MLNANRMSLQAGLGGKGGPYRLDKGHQVHQLSDEEKDNIPEHVKRAAKEMNRKAFAEKLNEIQMSSYDHKIYESFSAPVQYQVQQLRVILSSLQAKSHCPRARVNNTVSDEAGAETLPRASNIDQLIFLCERNGASSLRRYHAYHMLDLCGIVREQ